MEEAGYGVIAIWGFIYFVLAFVCIFVGITPAPSLSVFREVVTKIEEMDVTVEKSKNIVENSTKREYENNSFIVSGDNRSETETVIENDKIENNKAKDNKVENSKSVHYNSEVLVDKIKFAKKHKFTFLYNNKKVDAEDFDYKNSDVVVLNDLKLVIGMPK